jgi:hypothetical protein
VMEILKTTAAGLAVRVSTV